MNVAKSGYTLMIRSRRILFEEDKTYYIHYRTGHAPGAERKFYGAMFAGTSEGKLNFITPNGNPISIRPERIINAL